MFVANTEKLYKPFSFLNVDQQLVSTPGQNTFRQSSGAINIILELCVEAEEMYHQIASGRQAGSSMFGFDPQLTMGNPSSCCVRTKPTSELACEIQTIQSNSIPAGGKLSVADDLQISGMERQEITLNKTILDEMRQALCRMHSSQECGNSATITAMPSARKEKCIRKGRAFRYKRRQKMQNPL
ncbi:hypothetical protein T4A_3752 [Trichinella pseudospiralis]|uniref:Uncharacterized protein n=1 Tax=Trichinella pseudospiralis TaxID=6337 RepID=A0A0V1EVW6_TRIPS|nr:hypothetical protein T4A_3752 [Trichinella pseudospiralis]